QTPHARPSWLTTTARSDAAGSSGPQTAAPAKRAQTAPTRHLRAPPRAPRDPRSGSRPRNGPALAHHRPRPPHRAALSHTAFFAVGRPNPGSDSQPKSGRRKITRNLTLDLATFTRTGQLSAPALSPVCDLGLSDLGAWCPTLVLLAHDRAWTV